MSELAVLTWIRRLDETRAVQLARSIIHSEAGKLGLAVGSHSMSGRVKAKDQGVDGRTDFPHHIGTILPTGSQVWQVKSGPSVPSADKELKPTNTGLIEAIKGGRNYVLFWTNDPSDTTRTTVEGAFRKAVKAIRETAEVTFIFGDEIQRLFNRHRALLALIPEFPLGGLIDLNAWRRIQGFEIDYQPDGTREAHAAMIRAHVQSESTSTALNLYGDTGVGKSRLVLEALSQDGVAERVLVALTPDALDKNLITSIANAPESSLVLVLDDCGPAERAAIKSLADLAQGRIRLITIGPRYSREQSSPDTRFLEVLPLATSASRAIALSTGLSEPNAELVARYTEGYPKLAYELANSIAHGDPSAHLLDRIRSETVGGVLSSMLANETDAGLLGSLAIFERLGYDGDLSAETRIACAILDIDEQAFRIVVDRETGRFVSTAGRYRLVSPRLFAVWLAAGYIKKDGLAFQKALKQLPESLRDQVLSQMKSFAGDRDVGAALATVVGESPLVVGALADVDEGSARLLHVAAIVEPSIAMAAINTAFATHLPDELVALSGGARRAVVEALAVLLWFDETFERAATAALHLAVAENENWSNNATGIIQGIFKVFLGGTSVPYPRRIAWCREALQKLPESQPILISGLAGALEGHEMRTHTEFESRGAPTEWRPETVDEEISARQSAWNLLVELARNGVHMDEIAAALANGLRTAAARGLTQEILATLPTVEWSPHARVRLAESIQHLLEYDSAPEQVGARFSQLAQDLIGTTPAERIEYLLKKNPWELFDDLTEGRPGALLAEITQLLAASPVAEVLTVAAMAKESDPQTAALLFDFVAQSANNETFLGLLETHHGQIDFALLGTFSGLAKRREPDWAVARLRSWLGGQLGRLVLDAAYRVPATPALADVVLDAVEQDAVDPSQLSRLLHGAWARNLPGSQVARIAALLADGDDPVRIEHALGIISQWLDVHPDQVEQELGDAAAIIVKQSSRVGGRERSRSALYRQRVLTRLNVSTQEDLQVVVDVLSGLNAFPAPSDLQMLDDVVRKAPTEAIRAIMQLLLPSESSSRLNVLWLDNANLLTRLANQAPNEVIQAIRATDHSRWRELPAHVDFTGDTPNDLTRVLVLESTDEVVRARAAFRLIYPENFWAGNESSYLQRRREVVESWLREADDNRFQDWIRDILHEIDQRIAESLLSEAEEE